LPRTLAAAMAMPLEVCAAVGGFLQLADGIAANPKNLEVMLAHILKNGHHEIHRATPTVARPKFIFNVIGTKRRPELVLDVFPPTLSTGRWQDNLTIMRSMQPATADGLLACFVDGRAALKAMARGLCETCGAMEPPLKRLKGAGLPVCVDCALYASFDL